jgi:hypothetical protein
MEVEDIGIQGDKVKGGDANIYIAIGDGSPYILTSVFLSHLC